MQKFLKIVFEFRTVLFFIGVAIAFWLISSTVRVIQKNYNEQLRVDGLNQQITVIELENNNLKLNNEFYKTNSYLELEARRRLNKVAAGEKVLILPKQAKTNSDLLADDAQTDKRPQFKQNIEAWTYFLFGKEPEEN